MLVRWLQIDGKNSRNLAREILELAQHIQGFPCLPLELLHHRSDFPKPNSRLAGETLKA